jgi:type IV secretory pathway protease TraF
MRAGRLAVNGVPAPWPFRVVKPGADRALDGPIAGSIYTWGPVTVGPDSVFVLSDTRDMIGWPDSRFFGAVPLSRVVGRYWIALWKGERERGGGSGT